MRIRVIVIAMICMLLIVGTSPVGYCYSNVDAKKTNVDVSEDHGTLTIGLSSGEEISIATSAIVGSGVIAGVGTYYVISTASCWEGLYIGDIVSDGVVFLRFGDILVTSDEAAIMFWSVLGVNMEGSLGAFPTIPSLCGCYYAAPAAGIAMLVVAAIGVTVWTWS